MRFEAEKAVAHIAYKIGTRLLVVQPSSNLDGAAISGLLLAKALVQSGQAVHVCFNGPGPAVREYEAAGCKIHFVTHGNWLSGDSIYTNLRRWAKEVPAVMRFRRLIRSLRPSLVYINSIVSGAAAIAAKVESTPCIWHLRELFKDVDGEMCVPRLGGRSLVRPAVTGLADEIIAPSKAIVGNLLGQPQPARTSIIPNAVPAACFSASATKSDCRSALNLHANGKLIGVPGTLRPVKGHAFFLRAIAPVLRGIPDVSVAIGGDGERALSDALHEQVKQLGIEERVHFTGRLSLDQMISFYRACDVICVPSKSESFGRTIIEAFACGVPVVATRVGGIPEIIEHDETGLLVEYGDAEGLADALERALADPELRQRLTANARAKAERCYHEREYGRRILEIVDRVLDRR